MGNSLKICYKCAKQTEDNSIVILLAGLDNAGKTRTVGLLVGNGAGSEAPTVGFQPAQLHYRNRLVHLHDVGGCGQFRRAWRHYYADTHGLIFVVDSADRARLHECAQVLEEVLAHPHISGKPVLILANKQDLKGAMDDLDIVEKLNIEAIVNRYKCPTRVESYTATIPKGKNPKRHIDPGLKKGYEWLLNYVIHKYNDINLKVKNDVSKVMNDSKTSEVIIDESSPGDSETGFENPNYRMDTVEENSSSDDGIIVVQQAPDKILKTNGNVKLSPLFGGKNVGEDFGKKSIELEARTHIQKLSPISKHRVFVAPSIEKTLPAHTTSSNANEIFANQLKKFKSQDSLNEINNRNPSGVSASKFTEISLGDSGDVEVIPNIKLEANRKILPPIKGFIAKDDISPKKNTTYSDEKAAEIDTSNIERPKSASESIRKQLENSSNSGHTRKIGLRKNRTTPEESTSLFIFDPSKSQSSKSSFAENSYNKVLTRTDAII